MAGLPGISAPRPSSFTSAATRLAVPKPPKPPGPPKGSTLALRDGPPVYKPPRPAANAAANSGGVAPPSGSGTAPDGSAVPPPSPYDATYYNQLNTATLNANNKINTYNADIANGRTGLNNTLALLAHNQALAVQRAQDAENARGGFAQGALGQTLGNLNQAYLDTQSADQNKYAQQAAAWNQAIAGVNAGLSTEQIALGLASAARQAAITAKSPGTSGGAVSTAASGVTSAPAGTSSVAANAAASRYPVPSAVGANLGQQLAAAKSKKAPASKPPRGSTLSIRD